MPAVSHIIRGEEFILLPEKAIYWPKEEALLLADLHLGKVTHFRKAGIGLPKSVELDNLERLAQLILDHKARSVYLLGDLFHSHYNDQWPIFQAFMKAFKDTEFILIKGNHDILNESAYIAENLTYFPESLELGPFLMTHIPIEYTSELYNICGHLHPGVRLKGRGLQALKLPCFHFGKKGLVLPAYGAFTGSAKIEPNKEDDVFAISDTAVIKVL